MTDRVIPLIEERSRGRIPPMTAASDTATNGVLSDAHGRPLRDLRISVTDRCNFRCSYCMPKEVFDHYHRFLPQPELLSFEEITRLARIFVAQGVDKLRITGGEPLLRRHVEDLIAMLSQLQRPDGSPVDIALTTNGSLLAKKAQALKDAGLRRVTVSLDALDDAVFQRMNDVGFPVAEVLHGIEVAQSVGLGPVKVNVVVKRGVNDEQVLPLVRHFRGTGVVLRFIEFMDVGASNGWRMDDVLPSAELLARLQQSFDLMPLEASRPGETATRWQHADGSGEIGLISSVTQAFCGDCNRARLSTEGQLYTCLFATEGHDLRALVRGAPGLPPCDDAQIAAALGNIWRPRQDRYSQLRGLAQAPARPKIEMHYIGG